MPADLDLCIVGGCGHVGLPLALSFADAGLRVGIHDLDQAKIDMVRSGVMPFVESGAPELLARVLAGGTLELSNGSSMVSRADAVVLVIGTPIDEFLNPSVRVVHQVIADVAPQLRPATLVILRSTVYPGTTDWVIRELADRGCDVEVAFCPERIAEGHALEELRTLPQLIGATSDATAQRAEALFSKLATSFIRTTPKEAELAKLLTNSWRYLKFAIANQFFMVAHEAGIDYTNVLRAIRHDYPRARDLPAPGFAAGPCLLKDTMQLSAFTANDFILGHGAMLVNEALPDFVTRSLDRQIGLRGRTVAILGMAFKAESDDIRASLSYKLKKSLSLAGARVVTTDPYVADPDLVDLPTALARSEIVVIGAPHASYRDIDLGDRRVVDIWDLRGQGIRI
ncbi:MAG: nucleotide sugar dehydrogenase [Acidimicrobiales bacterium]